MEEAAIKATAILTAVIWTKHLITNLGLGGKKFQSGDRAPEDTYQKQPGLVNAPNEELSENESGSNIGNNQGSGSEVAKLKEDTQRWQRITNNDLENIPLGVIVAWASIFTILFGEDNDVRERQALAQMSLYGVFVGARIMHSIAYANALSYTRTLAYTVGVLAAIGMLSNLVIASFHVRSFD